LIVVSTKAQKATPSMTCCVQRVTTSDGLLRMIVKKALGLLLCLLQATGLTALMAKLNENICQNRLQNSNQRRAQA
jgi:hypothetical protein